MDRKSRVKCYYLGCNNNRVDSPNKCFFKIPGGSEKLKIWLTCMGRLDLATTKRPTALHNNVRVCADHFEARYFTSTLRTRLHCEAIPIKTTFQNKAIKQDHSYGYLQEESAENQEQVYDEHTEKQFWFENSRGSRWSATFHCEGQNTSRQRRLSETIARNSDTQNSLECSQSAEGFDAVDHLFLSWAKTVKTFSPPRLIETKREIANIILKREEEQLEEDFRSNQATIKIEEITLT